MLSNSNSPAMGGVAAHQIRMLRAPSNLILITSRDGESTSSLSNLFQHLNTL